MISDVEDHIQVRAREQRGLNNVRFGWFGGREVPCAIASSQIAEESLHQRLFRRQNLRPRYLLEHLREGWPPRSGEAEPAYRAFGTRWQSDRRAADGTGGWFGHPNRRVQRGHASCSRDGPSWRSRH